MCGLTQAVPGGRCHKKEPLPKKGRELVDKRRLPLALERCSAQDMYCPATEGDTEPQLPTVVTSYCKCPLFPPFPLHACSLPMVPPPMHCLLPVLAETQTQTAMKRLWEWEELPEQPCDQELGSAKA
jgi:hypothetical protein